jgi:hypothetical protein
MEATTTEYLTNSRIIEHNATQIDRIITDVSEGKHDSRFKKLDILEHP